MRSVCPYNEETEEGSYLVVIMDIMDIKGAEISFNCPDCGFMNTATLQNAINGNSLICVGCLKTIQLVDGNGDTKRAVDEVNQGFNDLGKAFKRGY